MIEIENLPASELINTKTLHLRAHVALTCFAFLSWFSGMVIIQQATLTFLAISLAREASPWCVHSSGLCRWTSDSGPARLSRSLWLKGSLKRSLTGGGPLGSHCANLLLLRNRKAKKKPKVTPKLRVNMKFLVNGVPASNDISKWWGQRKLKRRRIVYWIGAQCSLRVTNKGKQTDKAKHMFSDL